MEREFWIERLRSIATLAVIMIHVISGTYANATEFDITFRRVFDVSILMCLSTWSVPVFIMITGYFLLDPEKEFPLKKLWKYISRMIGVLLTFGLGFCLIESIISYKDFGILYIVKDAVINLLSGNSWAHMWYIYMLIGLYVLTPILRAFVKDTKNEVACFTLSALFVVTIIIPTLNHVFGMNLTGFNLQIGPYCFYYLFGYYVKKIKINIKIFDCLLVVSILLLFASSLIGINQSNNLFGYDNVFLAVFSMSIFYVSFVGRNKSVSNNKVVKYISKRSFCIYLMHTFALNVLNKGMDIFMTQLPIIVGELLFLMISFVFSILSYEVLSRIPGIKRII